MGLFDLLFGRQPDPTATWQASGDNWPAIRTEPFAFGKLRLGDEVEGARFLGKPDRCARHKAPGNLTLNYASRGLQLDYEEGRLVEVLFRIGYDTSSSADDGAAVCEPRLEDGTRLTQETGMDEIAQRWGEPKSKDSDDDETTWRYERGKVCQEFEFNDRQKLAAWTIYLDE